MTKVLFFRRKNLRAESFLTYSISSGRTIVFRYTSQPGKKKKASLGCRRCKITVEKTFCFGRDLFWIPCNLSKQVIPRNVHGRKT